MQYAVGTEMRDKLVYVDNEFFDPIVYFTLTI